MDLTQYIVQEWLSQIIMPVSGAMLGFLIMLSIIAMVFKSKFDN
jgi:hypothetical protein